MANVLAIVVTWNKSQVLDQMLASLEASGARMYDVVVVDNASTDDTVAMLRSKYSWIEVLENAENLGGTGGFNSGMRYGLNHPNNYEFLWLLDNDVIVHPGALEALLKAMKTDVRIGLAGSTILQLDDPASVQEAGVRIDWRTGVFLRNGEGSLVNLAADTLYESDFAAACSLLARTSAVREVGIWDPAYFVMWDDMDWGIRFRRAGWRVVGVSESLVRHESFDNRRARSPAFASYQRLRNALYCYRRHCPLERQPGLFYFQLRHSHSLVANYRAAGRDREAQAIEWAIRDFFEGRMGPPPPELFQKPQSTEPGGKTENLPRHVRRIALVAQDNPDFARQLHAQLTKQYPEAEIETVILNPTPSMLAEDLPYRQIREARTLLQRVALAVQLPLRYDMVASPAFLPNFFFLECIRYNLRANDQFELEARKRSISSLGILAGKRVIISIRAAIQSLRAMMKRLPPVDYHDFKR